MSITSSDLREQRLEAALRAAINGTATLFVGAGVSFLTRNAAHEPLPNGEVLSDIIHEKVGVVNRRHTLQSVSDYYRSKFGSVSLIELLKSVLEVREIDHNLENLYNKPWRRIYTTNYDLAIETSRKKINSQKFSQTDRPASVSEGATIHLNGHLDAAVPESLDEDITLTDRSYSLSNLSESPWMNLFLSDLRTSKAIIFIGYSLLDLDIAKALLVDPNLSRKTMIFVGPDTDDIDINRISKFGSVFSEGIEYLFSKLSKFEQEDFTPKIDEKLLICRELTLDPIESDKPAAELIFNQLVYGEAPLQEILSKKKISEQIEFLVPRSDIESLMNSNLESIRDIFVSGEFSSGKTFALIQIARSALEKGFRVFWVQDGPELIRDLGILAKLDGEIWVICDSYAGKIDALKTYIKLRKPGHKLVLCERAATHELVRVPIENEPSFGPSREVIVSKINQEEAKLFDHLIDFAGLWGDYAGFSPYSRAKILTNDLDSSLYRLLIEIIKSKRVQSEIKILLDPLRQDENAMRFFVTALIVNVIDFDFWINDWQHFYSVPDIRSIIKTHSGSLSHFINTDSSQIILRTGIVSQYILRNFASDDLILDCLVDMYDCSSRDLFRDDAFSQSLIHNYLT